MLGRRKNKDSEASSAAGHGPRVPRHSGAWTMLRKRLENESGLYILDNGFTSPQNINYLANMGHSLYMTDLVKDAWTGEWKTGEDADGNPIWNVQGFLDMTLNFSGRMFDVVLLWTALDYLPEAIIQPLVDRLHATMNPGGQVLALFHTRTKGEETTRVRFHLTSGSDLEMQLTEQFPIQRAFTNRSIEKLFSGWGGHKQFLAKDSLSEVIMTR